MSSAGGPRLRRKLPELEPAPSGDWVPRLSHATIAVSPTEIDTAAHAVAGTAADVLILADPDHVPDTELVTQLLWWQHQCHYAVSIATAAGADEGDWLSQFQRDSDFLDRAGFEAWRGAAAGTLAVPRDALVAAGGLNAAAGSGWQLELAYRLAQRGAVFIADDNANERRRSPMEATPELFDVIPLLPERRPDWRATHRVALMHVVLDCQTAPVAAGTTLAGVLDGEYRDVAVSVVGWPRGQDAPTDERVSYVDAVPVSSDPVPFRLELPAGCVVQPFSVRRMLNRMRESQVGLYQTLVEPDADARQRSFAIRLLRTAALERARLLTDDQGRRDDVIDELFGSTWVEGRRFGIRHYADTGELSLDPEDAEDEEVGAVTDEDDDAD
jgi:hypothetical protein